MWKIGANVKLLWNYQGILVEQAAIEMGSKQNNPVVSTTSSIHVCAAVVQ